MLIRTILTALFLASYSFAHAAVVLIIPDASTASSSFSSSYAAELTIDGSGLPASYTVNDVHADYGPGNHWTTAAGTPQDAFINWTFSTAQELGGMYVWNHLSTSPPAANDGYEVTLFDLTLFDQSDQVIANFNDQTLLPNDPSAQFVSFGAAYANVSRVLFEVEQVEQPTSQYTGLAEVAFVVPEPSTYALLTGLSVLGLVAYRRRKR